MLENSVPEMATVGDVVISVSHVSKTYKLYPSHQDRLKEALHPFRKRYHEEFSALNDVTFDIRRGESVGILGRNGAGKSTLLQLIAGVLNPTSGTIKVAGSISALLELGAGFNPDLTGRENVLLANTIQGVGETEIAERISLVESFADIGLFFDQPMKVYSSGMYARVAFAHAINVNPDVLIVDEILGVGDAKFQEKCYNKIRNLKDAGVCILFVSHSTDVIQRNCERAILLEGGRLAKYGPADAIVTEYHDLLYGAKEKARPKVENEFEIRDESTTCTQEPGPWQQGEIAAFLSNSIAVFYRERPYYNPNERRIGNREAEIVDLLVLADGIPKFSVLTGSETLNILIKIKYQRQVSSPQIGWGLTSVEGMVIGGSSTVMQGVELGSVEAGSVVIYDQEIRMALCGGQYFLNVAVGEYLDQQWIYFDARRSVIHLSVSDLGRGSGFFHFPSKVRVVNWSFHSEMRCP